MRIPIEGLDLVITTALTGLFVLPTLWHLASDLRDRPGRSFSLIPNKGRHIAASIVRLGLVGGAGVLTTSLGDSSTNLIIWLGLFTTLLGLNLAGATDRRLTIHAETGLVKWTKISLPWWPSTDRNTSFVDRVKRVHFDSGKKKMSILGVGELEQHWTSSYNGSVSSSGHNSEKTMAWVAQQVNDYLRAFKSHDSDSARARRDLYREQVEAASAPRRKREAARAESARRANVDKKQRKEDERAARLARKEQTRIRRVEEKFQQ